MSMKYIMFLSPTGVKTPIIFPETISHEGMANFMKGYTPVSAGFFDCESVITSGRSTSLDLSSNPEDGEIIVEELIPKY